MLTLVEMQQSNPETLRALALKSDNFQYTTALEQMAHAMDAHSIGAIGTRDAYVAKAVRAHLRAQEDERGQLARVRKIQGVVEANQAAQDPTKPGGKSVFKTIREKGVSIWSRDWIVR